ncbi:hypothetical protein FHS19_006835 [Paenibacillus rhizosphaerae]|uniref:Uncharacterized protein n=1 Tax=Paenibacillus rhizosphaerae TaxID=297318 RepID=A0A839U373_9BACL|nr:hypothetical protein [Paenibacillus rhizosphaerae]MBB3132108.1 hypothetical protein [Paenibacillus rhizosphaerae]
MPSNLPIPATSENLRLENCFSITVPSGITKILHFSVNADVEQAVCIYTEDKYKFKVKHSRDNQQTIELHGYHDIEAEYLITGWCLFPVPRPQWVQSRVKVLENGVEIGFDDYIGDDDFDDIKIRITNVGSSD